MVDQSGYEGGDRWGHGSSGWGPPVLLVLMLVIFALAIHQAYACWYTTKRMWEFFQCAFPGVP